MKFEVLYYLMNENMALVEIERKDLPTDTPKDSIYQWFMLKTGGAIEKLVFCSMKEEEVGDKNISVRVFENSELRFDKIFGKFVLLDELFLLKNCSEEQLPAALQEIISKKL